jgi:hypothetical protein
LYTNISGEESLVKTWNQIYPRIAYAQLLLLQATTQVSFAKIVNAVIIEGLIRLGKLPESASKAQTVLGITPQTPKKRDLLRITSGLPSPPEWWLDPRDANDEPLKWPNCLAQALQYQKNHPNGLYNWYVQTMLRAATAEELEAAKNRISSKLKA